jgi:YHS domain-containing protein
MKKTLLIITTLALLAGTTEIIHAANMTDQIAPTNAPASGTNAPVKPYPFNYCLISGDKLGEMGKPITTNYLGQQIKFCCPGCVKDFKKDPDAYIKKLLATEKKAAAAKK